MPPHITHLFHATLLGLALGAGIVAILAGVVLRRPILYGVGAAVYAVACLFATGVLP